MSRSASDSWDLASSVGATATMVAAARALASREPNPLIDDPYAAPLVRAAGNEYLPPDAQDRLFDNITELSAPGSRIATEHMDMSAVPDDWADKLTERTKRIGSGINLAELFYTAKRNSAADYLGARGWHNAILPTADAYAANGFKLPDDELAAFAGDSGCLTATRQ